MIVTFYDKNFVALQNNATLNVGKYDLIKKAVDFDEFSFTSEAFVEDVNPTFIVMKDDFGRYKYGAFAGVPQLNNNNQTECITSCLKTLFNNDVVLNFGNYIYLDDMLSYAFNQFNLQVLQGSFSIEVDLTDLSDIELGVLKPEQKIAVYNMWDLLVIYMKYYDCYMTSRIDLANKRLIYEIKKINKNTLPLKLWELGIKNYGKWVASLNETQCVVNCNGVISYGDKYILLSNNSITTNTSLRDLYPIKRKVVFKETADSDNVDNLISEGNIKAIELLIEARYNESIEIETFNIPSFENAGFGTQFEIYVKKGMLYKTLPLGEIHENQNGKKRLKIGYKADDIVFYI